MTRANTKQNAHAIYEEARRKLETIARDPNALPKLAGEAERQLHALGQGFETGWDSERGRARNLTAIAARLRAAIESSGQSAHADTLADVAGPAAPLARLLERIDEIVGKLPG